MARGFRRGIVGLGAAAGAALLAACTDPPPTHPTVALITIDTWRVDHFSATHTPNLWALAQEGERFANAWSPMGLTTPSHATMLTGLLPWEHGVEANNHHGYSLNPRIPVLPDRFPGFRAGAFVSAWPAGPEGGMGRGWEVFDGPDSSERPGSVAVKRALAWLPSDAPALLWVHLYEPHGPYEGAASTDVERYAEEVALADQMLAPLLQALRKRQARIVVAADHGEILLEERCGRQHERSTSAHVLHVPLFRWSPNGEPAVREERVGLTEVPALLAGTGWGAPGLTARTAWAAESGMCEPGCAIGCEPTGLAGRDRVVIDDGGRWVHRPGSGIFEEGKPKPEHRALLEAIPPLIAPGADPNPTALELLGYTVPPDGAPPGGAPPGGAPGVDVPPASPKAPSTRPVTPSRPPD
jgi:hypothetical protein